MEDHFYFDLVLRKKRSVLRKSLSWGSVLTRDKSESFQAVSQLMWWCISLETYTAAAAQLYFTLQLQISGCLSSWPDPRIWLHCFQWLHQYWLLTKISSLFEGLVLKCHVLCRYSIKKMMNQENEWRDQRDQSSDVGCCCWGSKKRLTITRMLLWSLSSFVSVRQSKGKVKGEMKLLRPSLSLCLQERQERERQVCLLLHQLRHVLSEGERDGGRRGKKSVRWRSRLPLVVGMEGQVLYDSVRVKQLLSVPHFFFVSKSILSSL